MSEYIITLIYNYNSNPLKFQASLIILSTSFFFPQALETSKKTFYFHKTLDYKWKFDYIFTLDTPKKIIENGTN